MGKSRRWRRFHDLRILRGFNTHKHTHTYTYVSSYLMRPHTSYSYSCVLIPHVCPHTTTICVLMLPSYYYMCWQAQQQEQHEAALQNGEGRVQNGKVDKEVETEVEREGKVEEGVGA